MDKLSLSELKPGDNLPIFVTAPITRQTLAVYCGASGDHNPIHVDIDFAKQSGLDDVIAHGMLVMSYCSRALLEYFPQTSIVKFDTRFIAMTHVGDEIREINRLAVAGQTVEKLQTILVSGGSDTGEWRQ